MAFNQTLLSFDYESGVYCIRFKDKDKVYIGSTKNFLQRYNEHIYDLSNKNHSNIHLQRAWDKYGENDFEFNIIEEHNLIGYDNKLKKVYLFNREQYYLNTLLKANENNNYFNKNSYNILRKVYGGGKKDREVLVFDLNMNFIESFINPKEASYKYGERRHTGITLCCNGKLGRVGDNIFRYADKLDIVFVKKKRKSGYLVKTKPIYRYNYTTGEYVDEWLSANHIKKQLKISNISKILSGKYHHEKGFTFRYYKVDKIVVSIKNTYMKCIEVFDVLSGEKFNVKSIKEASQITNIPLRTVHRKIKDGSIYNNQYYLKGLKNNNV